MKAMIAAEECYEVLRGPYRESGGVGDVSEGRGVGEKTWSINNFSHMPSLWWGRLRSSRRRHNREDPGIHAPVAVGGLSSRGFFHGSILTSVSSLDIVHPVHLGDEVGNYTSRFFSLTFVHLHYFFLNRCGIDVEAVADNST